MTPLNFRSLDLNLLRVFDEVMAERSLTRAAHKLSITQPAVSNAMRRLRDALGDELVVRSGQGVEPTPRGLALWPPVREALAHLQESLAPGHFDPAKAESTFVLAMADATAATLVPDLVQIIEREAPGISIRVLPLTTRDPRRQLEDEAADMAATSRRRWRTSQREPNRAARWCSKAGGSTMGSTCASCARVTRWPTRR